MWFWACYITFNPRKISFNFHENSLIFVRKNPFKSSSTKKNHRTTFCDLRKIPWFSFRNSFDIWYWKTGIVTKYFLGFPQGISLSFQGLFNICTKNPSNFHKKIRTVHTKNSFLFLRFVFKTFIINFYRFSTENFLNFFEIIFWNSTGNDFKLNVFFVFLALNDFWEISFYFVCNAITFLVCISTSTVIFSVSSCRR